MGNHHCHHHHHGETKNIKVAFFLNLFFTVIEIIGGVYTNSVAILSDALHDLGDSLSLGLAWYFQKYSQKGSDKVYSYGYRRFSLTGAIVNSLTLLVGSAFILSKAIPRILSPEPANVKGMVLLAILGIVVNGAAVLKLNKGSSLNEKVVSLHLLEDVLGWVAVLIGAVVMYFYNLPIIDPILSIVITGYVLFNIFKNLKQVFGILMQGVPKETNIKEITNYLSGISEIKEYHDLHIWSMDGEFNVLTVHLIVNENSRLMDLPPLKNKIRIGLNKFGIEHSTLEFESLDEKCEFVNCT